MDILIIIFVGIISIILGFILGHFVFKPKITDESENKELAHLTNELDHSKAENQKLSERGKINFAQITKLEAEQKSLHQKVEEKNTSISRFESKQEQSQKEHDDKIHKAEKARESWEDEKTRIRREDEARLESEEQNRNRIWNEHEQTALNHMKSISQKPELDFAFHDNTNLPPTFDGSLKPDFLIDFLGQFIIFDAKMSRSADLQTYLKTQVKSTCQKIQKASNESEIFKTIFFVVPTEAFSELKQISFLESGFTFFVIPKEAFEPIMASFKRIANFELAEKFDPQDRENIVNLIAAFDQHITLQNSRNILSSLEGIKTLAMKNTLPSEIKDEAEVKKSKLRLENFKPNELKRLAQNPEEQLKAIAKLVTPQKPNVKKAELETAAELF